MGGIRFCVFVCADRAMAPASQRVESLARRGGVTMAHLLAFLLGLMACDPARALEPDAIFAKVAPSVWTVTATDAQGSNTSQGSAVVVGSGRLVTSCQVLARMARFQVTKDNVSYGGKLEFPDPENDLCQIRVDNFHAPAVELADMAALRVGTRVYAIGTPQGPDTTLSDGLLSGLRRDKAGQLLFVQTTAPISPGSSGGGLFDAEGRLIGITTYARRESQNINLAVPAYRIAELPERGRQMLERRTADGATTAPTPSAAAPASPMTPAELTAQRQPGDWFEYVITDHHTKVKNRVSLRVDRVTGDRVVFNGGARVEGVDGQVLEANSPALVELDTVTPPGGWAPGGQVKSGVHRLKVSTTWQNQPATYDLTARASAEQIIRVGTTEYQAVRIDLQGWHSRAQMYAVVRDMPYRATVWYAPALRRVVRFNVEFRTAGAGVNETLELARAGRN
jgi:serine protease Do